MRTGTEACAVFILAFGLLQPEDATSFVRSSRLEAAPHQAGFFSPPEDFDPAQGLDEPEESQEELVTPVTNGEDDDALDKGSAAVLAPAPESPRDGALDDRPADPFVEASRLLARQIGEYHLAMLAAVQGGRYEEVPGVQGSLESARRELAERVSQKEKELGLETALPLPLPLSFATEEGIAGFVRKLGSKLAEVSERRARHVASERRPPRCRSAGARPDALTGRRSGDHACADRRHSPAGWGSDP